MQCNHCSSFVTLSVYSCSSHSIVAFVVPLHGDVFLSARCSLTPSPCRDGFDSKSPLRFFLFPCALPLYLFFGNIRVKKESPSFQAPRRRRSPPPRGFGKKAIKGSRCVLRAPESVGRSLHRPRSPGASSRGSLLGFL